MKIRYFVISLLALSCAGLAFGQAKGDPTFLLKSGAVEIQNLDGVTTSAPSGSVAEFSAVGVESWDAQLDPDNNVFEVNIGAGNAMTGVSWDVGVATVGASWLSEAQVAFTSTSDTASGLFLTVGAGEDDPGDMEFSSEGVLVFADNMIDDVEVDADGILRIEFFESFDDTADAIDANWRNAAEPFVVPGFGITCTDQAACDAAFAEFGGPDLPPPPAVPTLSLFGLLALALVLALGTALVLRRKA